MLHLRPKGRGNWRMITLAVGGIDPDLFRFRLEQDVVLAGRSYRIVKVTL